MPDRDGISEDVVMGFDDIDGYTSPQNANFGGTIGRCTNIIGHGRVYIHGKQINLTRNTKNGKHHMNGGFMGFDRCNWTAHLCKSIVESFRYFLSLLLYTFNMN